MAVINIFLILLVLLIVIIYVPSTKKKKGTTGDSERVPVDVESLINQNDYFEYYERTKNLETEVQADDLPVHNILGGVFLKNTPSGKFTLKPSEDGNLYLGGSDCKFSIPGNTIFYTNGQKSRVSFTVGKSCANKAGETYTGDYTFDGKVNVFKGTSKGYVVTIAFINTGDNNYKLNISFTVMFQKVSKTSEENSAMFIQD